MKIKGDTLVKMEKTDINHGMCRIPDGIRVVGYRAFYCCKSLERVVIPDSVEEINHQAFSGCKNLSIVAGGKNVKKIGSHAFMECKNLSSFPFYSGLKSIGESAFRQSGLKEVFFAVRIRRNR